MNKLPTPQQTSSPTPDFQVHKKEWKSVMAYFSLGCLEGSVIEPEMQYKIIFTIIFQLKFLTQLKLCFARQPGLDTHCRHNANIRSPSAKSIWLSLIPSPSPVSWTGETQSVFQSLFDVWVWLIGTANLSFVIFHLF